MTHINFKLAIRNLKKDRLYTSLSIIGFTLGFAIFLIIALFIFQEKTVDHSFANHQNIYRLIDAEKKKCNLNYDFSAAITTNFQEVKFSSPTYLISGTDIPLKSDSKILVVKSLATSTNDFFEIFSIKTIKKLSNKPFADPNSVVISESLAKRLFPNADPLGREINLFDRFHPVVSAVVEDFPANTSMEASVFLNMENEKFRFSKYCLNDNCTFLATHFMLLQDDLDVEQFIQKLNRYFSVSGGAVKKVSLQKLTDIYYADNIEGNRNKIGNAKLILILSAIAGLILILSVINQINFNLSLQLSRIKSIGIRKINGASQKHLSSYFFTEVSISVVLSMVLAVVIANLLLPYADQLLSTSLNPNSLFSTVFLTIIFAIVGTVILLNSLTSLHMLSRFNIPGFLSGNKTGSRRILQQNMLTIFQFSVSIVLITSILIMSKQVSFVKNSDLGFGAESLLRIDFPPEFKQQTAFQQKVEELAFVQSSSLSDGVPGAIGRILDDGEKFQIQEIAVDMNFLKTFDIQLVDGRNFLAGDADKAFLFNEAAFKGFEWEEKDKNQFQGKEIIGTVADFHVSSFHSGIEPVCLRLSNNPTQNISIKLMPGDVSQKIKMLHEIWNTFIPGKPMNYNFYDSWFDSLYKKEENLIKAIGTFGIIALIITCLGIFGQIYQDSISRTKEIGIRKINGAKVSEVMTMLNKNVAKWVAIAFIIATPIAYYAMNKWLENFAYKTELSWWIFALAGLLALGITLLTVSWQSWKAATRNPVEALRYE